MYNYDDIRDGARTLRQSIHYVLPAPDAEAMAQQLDTLLASDSPPDETATVVLELVATHETTREWMRRFLESTPHTKLFEELPGKAMVPLPIYTCPYGGCRWAIRDVGDPPQRCMVNNEPMGTPHEPRCPVQSIPLV
jgi:hypothetical protein